MNGDSIKKLVRRRLRQEARRGSKTHRDGWMAFQWLLLSQSPGVEKKVEQVFNLFALEMPRERRRVVGFEVGGAWRRVVAAPWLTGCFRRFHHA